MGIINKKYIAHPILVGIIGTRTDEKTNFMTAGWHTYLSHDPVLYGVAVGNDRYTNEMIKKSGEFNISFLSQDHILKIDSLGKTSGTIYNKIELMELNTLPGHSINTPYLSEAYAVLECKVINKILVGDHTFFIGEMIDAFGKVQLFDKDGVIYTNKAKPTLYLGKDNYITTDQESEKHFTIKK